MSSTKFNSFRRKVWTYWRENGRHDLPWRKTADPYRIMVSEVMLQQTQVSRVLEKYKVFLKKFPNIRAIAKAPLSDVLKAWSGLGYNRRGKYLHDAAKTIVSRHKGRVPVAYSELVELPGIGTYTASAIRVFAHNLPDILIETNIRAVYIQHFFPNRHNVTDQEILRKCKYLRLRKAREWHWALMDYGVHVKKMHKNPARRSRHHVPQSKFEGSLRQVRGAILRELHHEKPNLRLLKFDAEKMQSALLGLERDGLIIKERGRWRI